MRREIHRLGAGIGERLSRGLLALALAWGVYLRLRMYFMDRAFWLDPAALALNLVNKSYGALFAPLDHSQAAPVGFLLVSKLLGSFFDYQELALTFFPLLLALASLCLFLWLALEVMGTKGASLAFLPFAACSSAVYYAGEFKQYSGDLFFAVLTLLVSVRVWKSEFSRRAIIGFGIAGIVGCWFSHPAILVIAGSGIALLAIAVLRKNRGALVTLLSTGSVVVLHYLLLYFFQIRHSIASELLDYHAASYAPLPFSKAGLEWWRQAATGYCRFPLGFTSFMSVPLLGLALGGVAAVLNRDKRFLFGALVLPLGLVFLASAVHRYPIVTGQHEVNGRFLLFTVPFAFLLIGKGMQFLLERTRSPAWVAVVVSLFLFYSIVERTARWPHFIQQEMRDLVADLRGDLRRDDEVYVYSASIPAFRFYTREDPIAFVGGRPTSNPRSGLSLDLERLSRTGRVWIVISHDFGRERHHLIRSMTVACAHDLEKTYPGARLLRFECRQ